MDVRFRFYKVIGGVETEISNLLSATCQIGRRSQLDAYRANTASVEIRYPTGYASPDPQLVPGTEVRLYTDAGIVSGVPTKRQIFAGSITDAEVTYGKPYFSGEGPADILTISCESYFAALGRQQGLNYSVAANTLQNQITAVNTQFGTNIVTVSGFGSANTFSQTNISGSIGDWANLVLLTMNGRLEDGGPTFGIVLSNQYLKKTNVFNNFSDVRGPSYNPYTEITFDSLADNYYTQVTVDPEDYTAQTAQTGSAPYRTYQVNTLNSSEGQALDYANYLLSTYKDPTLAISSFRVFLNDTTANPSYGYSNLGTQIEITFRGVTYNCILEGATFSGAPERGIYATYFVSSEDLNNYLLLDNAVYGRLDFNKLGY